MNTDGSNQRRVTSVPYWCSHPTWSADGRKIAFDAGQSIDGFQSIWEYAMDTGQTAELLPTQYLVDKEVNAYLTQDRYIGFTEVTYIVVNNALQVSTFTPKALAMEKQPFQVVNGMPIGGLIWRFDWRSTDPYPPVTTFQPLPAISSSQVTVRWSGQDVGSSGLTDYEFKYTHYLNPDSDEYYWFTLPSTTMTQFSIEGLRGKTYTFMVRAKDAAGNYEAWNPVNSIKTTIETLKPSGVIHVLPKYAPKSGFKMSWTAWDLGGSQVKTTNLYPTENCEPAEIIPQTNEFSIFTTNAGSIKIIDRALNYSECIRPPWQVQLYQTAITGKVFDIQGKPLKGVVPNHLPNEVLAVASDDAGKYLLYTAQAGDAVDWTKTGYGSPSPMQIADSNPPEQIEQNVYMPPANNVIINGGIEQSFTSENWQSSGTLPVTPDQSMPFWGNLAAYFGKPVVSSAAIFQTTCRAICNPISEIDAAGNVHMVWLGIGLWKYELRYATKPSGGSWSTPTLLYELAFDADYEDVSLFVHPDGRVFVYFEGGRPTYANLLVRQINGTWDSPVILKPENWNMRGKPVMDSLGNLHFIGNDGTVTLKYLIWSNGTFILEEPVATNLTFPLGLGLDSDDLPLFVAYDGNRYVVANRLIDGTWNQYPSPVESLELDGFAAFVVRDQNKTLHLQYNQKNSGWMKSISLPVGSSTWSLPVTLVEETYGALQYQWLNKNGAAYIYWLDGAKQYQLRQLKPINGWSWPEKLQTGFDNVKSIRSRVSSDGSLHFIASNLLNNYVYFKRQSNGQFTISLPVEVSTEVFPWIQFIVKSDGQPYVYWFGKPPSIFGGNVKFYDAWQSSPAVSAGDSRLSQSITIPADMLNPGLGFMYRIAGMSAGAEGLKVTVTDGETTTTLFESSTETEWAHAYADMSAWKGKTITLTFVSAYAEGTRLPAIMLDEVMLGSTYPDAWVKVTPDVTRAMAGESFGVRLIFATRGLPVQGVELALVLPADVEFVSADIAPLEDGSTLRWSPGALAPLDGEQTITVTLRVKDGAAALQKIYLPVSLTSTAEEKETENNFAVAELRTEITVYIPAAAR
jgi:hypothetical protein